jgi:hypothetical protein
MKLLRVVRPGGLQGSRHEKWGWASFFATTHPVRREGVAIEGRKRWLGEIPKHFVGNFGLLRKEKKVLKKDKFDARADNQNKYPALKIFLRDSTVKPLAHQTTQKEERNEAQFDHPQF